MANSKCPLLALPPELRNRVWTLVLASNYPGSHFHSEPTGVTQVNRQTRNETLAMHYAQSTFVLDSKDRFNINSEWLRTIGDTAAKQIRHVLLFNPRDREPPSFRLAAIHVLLDEGDVGEMLVWEPLEQWDQRDSDDPIDAILRAIAGSEAASVKALLEKELSARLERSGKGLTGDDWRALMKLFTEG
ncbi:hypothetical protein LTR97_000329 [Elasticomyces elasticus]|uniref:Uncharacterized protein n=1 Tax=Elasticomyces elasticus TaxID=574655 RepID=A0AAN7WR48_9PEZI|nr:hypothetical protein LTR97_000329 [Elasticomyces elasticus]